MYEAATLQAFKIIENYDVEVDRVKRVIIAMQKESDRACAILIFSLSEDLMLRCLSRNLRPVTKIRWKSITGGNGPLSTAANRIEILELLYWISSPVAQDLRLLKSIRNRFAHHADVESFEDQEIRGWISSLSPRDSVIFPIMAAGNIPPRSVSVRELFIMRSISTIIHMLSELATHPTAMRSHIAPAAILNKDLDNLPENLRLLRLLTAEIYIKYHVGETDLSGALSI
jgi:DNA-binding MltR family transcriptional regulator